MHLDTPAQGRFYVARGFPVVGRNARRDVIAVALDNDELLLGAHDVVGPTHLG